MHLRQHYACRAAAVSVTDVASSGRLRDHAPRGDACRLTSTPSRVRVARSSPVGLRVRRTWRFKEIDLLPRREGTSRDGWQPVADALLTIKVRRQLDATDGNGFGLLEPFPRPSHLPPVAAGCARLALSEEGPVVKSSLLAHLRFCSRTVEAHLFLGV